MAISLSGAGVSMTGEGAFDFGAGFGRLTMDAGAAGLGTGGTIEMVMADFVLYMKMGALPGLDPAKPWLKLDLKALGSLGGQAFGSIGSSDPAWLLQQLRGVSDDITKVGTETIRGTVATHFRATMDLDKAAAEVPEAFRQNFEQGRKQLGAATIPVEVWIDDEGRAVKIVETVPFQADPGLPSGTMTVTIELFEFGTKVDVSPPPPDQVTDLSSLAPAAPSAPAS